MSSILVRRPRRMLVGVLAVTALAVGGAVAAPGAPPESALAGWPRQLGSTQTDDAYAVAAMSTGDVVVAGTTNGAVQPGVVKLGSDADAFVARFDKYGRLQWVRQFGTTGYEELLGVTVSGSSIYIAGRTGGTFPGNTGLGKADGFLARYSTSGTQQWVRQFGTAGDDSAIGVGVSGTGVFVGGNTNGAFPGSTNQGSGDAWVARFNSSGTQQWVRQLGSPEWDEVDGVAVSGSGVYLAGFTRGVLPGSTSSGNGDAFLVRYSTSGTQQWIRQFGTDQQDVAYGVAASGSSIYVGGNTYGTFPGGTSQGGSDGFVARYNSSGTQQWVRQLGTTSGDDALAVAAKSGRVYLAGYTSGSFPGFVAQSDDGFVAGYDTSGNQLWVRQFGTSLSDVVTGVAVRPNDSYGGAVVAVGQTVGAVWGQVNAGGYDGFIATMLG